MDGSFENVRSAAFVELAAGPLPLSELTGRLKLSAALPHGWDEDDVDEVLDTDDCWMSEMGTVALTDIMLNGATFCHRPTRSELERTLNVAALAAPFTINTMPEETLLAFADHGTLGDLMAADGGTSEKTLVELARIGIDQTALGTQLQSEGADSFDTSWRSLLGCVAGKHERLS